MSQSLKTKLRSPAVMITVAALALAAVGAKFFWPESAALKMPVTSKTKVAAKQPGASGKNAPAKNAMAAPTKNVKPKATEKPALAEPVDEPTTNVPEAPAAEPAPAEVHPISTAPRRVTHV